MKKNSILTVFLVFFTTLGFAQQDNPAEIFWTNLKAHCGKAYEGRLGEGISDPSFAGKRLLMHVRSCEENSIRIPFVVGDDLSRTWVLTLQDGRITLKHDHRLEDGSEDEVTQYGGTASNGGFAGLQMFPADQETASRIGYASTNVWWFTISDTEITYNLRRIGSDRLFTVVFDLSNPVDAPPAPWGWED